MKNRSCWKDLNAQSSQKVIEELSDAFQSWFDLRHKFDEANPPGYRKHGDTRPRSTVTFKEDGFKRPREQPPPELRLSKGSNLKEYWSDFLLCEYQTRPDIDLSEVVNRVQNVRAVWNGDEWVWTSSAKSNSKRTTRRRRSPGIDRHQEHRHGRVPGRIRSPTPVTRSKKTSTTSNEPSTTPKVRTAPRRSRCGHVGNSQTVRRTSTTSSRTP